MISKSAPACESHAANHCEAAGEKYTVTDSAPAQASDSAADNCHCAFHGHSCCHPVFLVSQIAPKFGISLSGSELASFLSLLPLTAVLDGPFQPPKA